MGLCRKRYLSHRIIYRMMTGLDPGINQIDHINGVRHDNRWSNLRLVTVNENQQNVGLQKNNTSGFKGVSWHKKRQCWHGRISVGPERDRKIISVGQHATPESAAAAIRLAREKLHTAFTNHGTGSITLDH